MYLKVGKYIIITTCIFFLNKLSYRCECGTKYKCLLLFCEKGKKVDICVVTFFMSVCVCAFFQSIGAFNIPSLFYDAK